MVSSLRSGRLANGMAIFLVDLAALLTLDAGPKFRIACLCFVCQSGDCSPSGRRDVHFPVDQLHLL